MPYLTPVTTQYDETAKFPIGTESQYPGSDPDRKIVYLPVLSSAVAVAVTAGACTAGKPGLYLPENNGVEYFGGITNSDYLNGYMVIGLLSAPVGTYCWHQYKGRVTAANKDGTAFTAGDAIEFESISNTKSRRICNIGIGSKVSRTQRLQGYVPVDANYNSAGALSASSTQCSIVLYGW